MIKAETPDSNSKSLTARVPAAATKRRPGEPILLEEANGDEGSASLTTGVRRKPGRRSKTLLRYAFPSMFAELHANRNPGIDLEALGTGSNQMVEWKCDGGSDHIWRSKVCNRTSGESGCQFCRGRLLSVTNSLATVRPDLAAEFDPDLNGGDTAPQVLAGGTRIATWKCAKGPDHIWQVRISSRVHGAKTGCPFCSNLRLSVTNTLTVVSPDLAVQLDPTLNEGVTADQIVGAGDRRFVWRCSTNPAHIWTTSIAARLKNGGCPACLKYRLTEDNSLAAQRPDLAAQMHPELNGGKGPADVVAGGATVVTWKCAAGPDHIWKAKIAARVRGSGCLACAGIQVSVTNCLAVLHPAVAAQLDPALNDGLTPDRVISGSALRLTWRCPHGSDHIWKTRVDHRTSGSRCPYCLNQRASVTNSLATVNPTLAGEMDSALNGGLTAADVVSGSTKKIWWRCATNPEHTWKAMVASRTRGDEVGCPKCMRNGFNPGRPGFLYLLQRWDGEPQRKLGITNVPETRIETLARHGWRLIEVSLPLDGTVARDVERQFYALLNERGVSRLGVRGDARRYPGHTETWTNADFPVRSLQEVYAAVGLSPVPLALADGQRVAEVEAVVEVSPVGVAA